MKKKETEMEAALMNNRLFPECSLHREEKSLIMRLQLECQFKQVNVLVEILESMSKFNVI